MLDAVASRPGEVPILLADQGEAKRSSAAFSTVKVSARGHVALDPDRRLSQALKVAGYPATAFVAATARSCSSSSANCHAPPSRWNRISKETPMNRRNLLSRGLLAALAFAARSRPSSPQQPDLSRKAVVDDPVAPKRAGKTYDVTVVEFFDYNCPYCRRMEPVLNALLHSTRRYGSCTGTGRSSDLPRVRRPRRPSRANGRAGMPPFTRRCMTSPARLDSAGVKAAAAKARVDWPRLQRDLKTRGAEIDACSRAPMASPKRSVSTGRRR